MKEFTQLKIMQNNEIIFNWNVLYFSFLEYKIIFLRINWNYVEYPLTENWGIYKNWTLRYKSSVVQQKWNAHRLSILQAV
jgi:hypothetical protein